MSAREEVLARVRAANVAARPAEPERAYRRTGEHPPGSPALLDLLAERLVDYRATVLRAHSGEAEAVRRAVAAAVVAIPGDGPVLLAPGLPSKWAPDGVVDDGRSDPGELERFRVVVTGAAAACAETGTIALDASAGQGRRAITLIPDAHVCVVSAEQVVQTVPELLARLAPTRPITLISGPSATSDIELIRVEGVHGPRTLSVVLLDPEPGAAEAGHR